MLQPERYGMAAHAPLPALVTAVARQLARSSVRLPGAIGFVLTTMLVLHRTRLSRRDVLLVSWPFLGDEARIPEDPPIKKRCLF